MAIKLYPDNKADRYLFWSGLWFLAIWAISIRVVGIGGINFILIFTGVGCMILAWGFPRKRQSLNIKKHSQMINMLNQTSNSLVEIRSFLQQEKKKVLATQNTLNHLKQKKSELDPIVTTQRETVNAILEAHSRSTRQYVWKNRFIGFLIGVISSVIASLLVG